MQVDFTPEQEFQLSQAAVFNGKAAEQLVREAALRYVLEQEAEFLAAVDEGIEAADRGELVDHAEVWASIEKILKP